MAIEDITIPSLRRSTKRKKPERKTFTIPYPVNR
jgi:hypothetical protein